METTSKIALVTGGSRGLGKDMALRLADKGINVVLTYNDNKSAADEVVQSIQGRGLKAASLKLNVADIAGLDGFVTQLQQTLSAEFGTNKLDFLINNAGTGQGAPFGQIDEKLFDDLVNIHLKGVLFLSQKVLTIMNDGGGFINISSGLARFSMPGYATYAALKGGIEVLTRYMAKELGPRGIRANVVAPGAIATDFGGGRVRDNQQLSDHVSSITALGRVGLAEDIGGVVAFLCTEDARWITGQRIEVSGGMNL